VSNGSWPCLYLVSEFASDDAFGGGGPDDRSCRVIDRMDMSYNSSDVSFMSGLWSDYYKGINRCNQLLMQIDEIDFSSTDARNAVEGEVKAIRGLEYFDLVKLFENVPLLTVPTSEIVAQAAPDSVYAQIVSDLKFAADNIPEGYYKDKSTSLGRINRYAAGAMLARVYLFYDGVYNNNQRGTMPGGLTAENALKYCEDAIKSGQYSLESDFKDLWPAASTTASSPDDGWKTTYKEASDEILWVVKFNNDQDWTNDNINGNRFIVDMGVRNISDGSCAPYGNGWGQGTITRGAYQLFQSGDTRRDASIIDLTLSGAYDTQITTDAMDATGYVNEKYCPLIYSDGSSIPVAQAVGETSGANFQTTQDQDWILMRYSDVLLMAAELGSAKAMEYFNQVRERAFGNKEHNLSSAPTVQQIWDERRVEFLGEGLRYWDLRRQGLDAFVAAQLKQGQVVYNNTVAEDISSSFKEANFREKRGFWQIPNDEISLSGGVYKQNAGW